jgi:hypothetical protein
VAPKKTKVRNILVCTEAKSNTKSLEKAASVELSPESPYQTKNKAPSVYETLGERRPSTNMTPPLQNVEIKKLLGAGNFGTKS